MEPTNQEVQVQMIVGSAMSQVMEVTSPRHVLRFLETYSRHRAEHMETSDEFMKRPDARQRLRTHRLIAHSLKQLLHDLEITDPEAKQAPDGD